MRKNSIKVSSQEHTLCNYWYVQLCSNNGLRIRHDAVSNIIVTDAAATHVKKEEECVDVCPRKKKDGQGHSIHTCLSFQLHAGHHLGMHFRGEQWVRQRTEVLLQEAGAVNDMHTGREAASCIQQFLDTKRKTEILVITCSTLSMLIFSFQIIKWDRVGLWLKV